MSDVKDAVVSATYSLACFVYIIFVYFLIVYTGPFLSFSPFKRSYHIYLPLDPKTMKNEGFKPPIYGL